MPEIAIRTGSILGGLKPTPGVGLGVALRLTIFTLILTGILYPLSVLFVGNILFSHKAKGSLVNIKGGPIASESELPHAVGSELLAQKFIDDMYFWPRPSLDRYQSTGMLGGTLGRYSPDFLETAKNFLPRLKMGNFVLSGDIPLALVSPSCSGVDPHLDKESILWQIPRIAKARSAKTRTDNKLVTHIISTLVESTCEMGLCNVLMLNLALDNKLGFKN